MRFVPYLAGLLLLSACAGPIITQEGPKSRHIDSLYGYGASARDLRLEVKGNAFAGLLDDQAFAKRVEAGLQGQLPRAPTHPTLTPDDSARDNYRLIFLFDPSPTISGQGLCDGKAERQEAVAGEVHILAAFCVAGRAETEAAGWSRVTGPGDADFARLLDLMMQVLFRPDEKESVYNRYPG